MERKIKTTCTTTRYKWCENKSDAKLAPLLFAVQLDVFGWVFREQKVNETWGKGEVESINEFLLFGRMQLNNICSRSAKGKSSANGL